VDALRDALAVLPDDAELHRRLAVAERVLAKSHYYDVAREFGRLAGEAGNKPGGPRMVVMTGGGPGLMEAANRGAFDAAAPAAGLNISLPHEQYPNPYITPELCFKFHYFAMRKMHLAMRANALAVFPGGFGTMDELFETLTLVQTHKVPNLPLVLMGTRFWRGLFAWLGRAMEAHRFISRGDLALARLTDDPQEAIDIVESYYNKRKHAANFM